MDISFLFQLNKDSTTKTAYQLGFLEAEVTILVDGQVFFQDPYITIAELGVQLGKWIQHVNEGRFITMNYRSIDHEEPIITFVYAGNHEWKIASIWQKFSLEENIPTVTLIDTIWTFLKELNDDLKAINYVLRLDKYLKD